MADSNPGFFVRIFMAFAVFFRVIFDGEFAGGVRRLGSGEAAPEPTPAPEPENAPEPAPPPRPTLVENTPDAALQLLSILQREGRLLDFLAEDVSAYSDADIGAAARVVHDDCKKALDAHVQLSPIRNEEEGSSVTLEPNFEASQVRLVGNVVGEGPFTGTLSHRGWKAQTIELPKLSEGHDVRVLASAEVEL